MRLQALVSVIRYTASVDVSAHRQKRDSRQKRTLAVGTESGGRQPRPVGHRNGERRTSSPSIRRALSGSDGRSTDRGLELDRRAVGGFIRCV